MKKVAMPYDGCAMTEGRNTIRKEVEHYLKEHTCFI
jgi:hypothetical protein